MQWRSAGEMALNLDDGIGAIARLGESIVLLVIQAEAAIADTADASGGRTRESTSKA